MLVTEIDFLEVSFTALSRHRFARERERVELLRADHNVLLSSSAIRGWRRLA